MENLARVRCRTELMAYSEQAVTSRRAGRFKWFSWNPSPSSFEDFAMIDQSKPSQLSRLLVTF
jgi:hypothetical protein